FVALLVGLGFHVHSFGFRFALLEDALGFGFALSADRRGMSFGFRDQTLLLRRGQSLNPLTLDLGTLQNSRDQFFLTAINFRFLNFDLLFFLNLLHLHLLSDDLLLHDIGLNVIRLVG